MKKRALSLLMSLVMLVSMLPTSAWAASEDQKSVTVQASFYDGESQQFTMPPQNLKVNSGEATKLEYMTDNLAKNADKVTVFDALVAVHEELLGLDKADAEVLDISDTGFVSTVMGAGYKEKPFSFAVNGGAPSDGVYNEDYKGYTAYSADQAVLSDGDEVQFFFYTDKTCPDLYTTFDKSEAQIKPGDTLQLTASGYLYSWYSYSTPEKIAEMTRPITGAQLYTIDDSGAWIPIDGAVTDSDGKVSVSFENEETYYLSLTSGNNDAIIAPVCKVTVSNDAPDQVRSCRLTSLNVMNFSGFTASPNKALELTPAFDPDVTEYKTAEWAYSSAKLDKRFGNGRGCDSQCKNSTEWTGGFWR